MKILGILMAAILVLSIASIAAESLYTNANASERAEANNSNEGIGSELSAEISTDRELLREGDYTGPSGVALNVREMSAELREFRVRNFSAKTDLELSLETDDKNEVHLKANLSNGRKAEIKIMPDRASETAIARLKLKVCSEANNCTIELKEVGAGASARAEYELKTDQDVKVLGLFKAKMHSEASVDAETGAVANVKQPWWRAFAVE